MKIKDIVSEAGLLGQTGKEIWKNIVGHQQYRQDADFIKKHFPAKVKVDPDAPKEPEQPAQPQPVTDIRDALPDKQTQFRFAYPEDPVIDVIIRAEGYFLTKLPKHLQGRVKKDPKNGLYPVLRPDSIEKINQYYDEAADQGRVQEEPIHAI